MPTWIYVKQVFEEVIYFDFSLSQRRRFLIITSSSKDIEDL